ncbi:uncharacterized protein LOC123224423 [Mangifera indica]|uniref:uncharacterized protein LOC123224423 n=1 Tax=Mangifera indica TaxID=29780 RepID=UPI001CF997D6|nr:uncharacterized protein LOC123224423 [Mangifera indica]
MDFIRFSSGNQDDAHPPYRYWIPMGFRSSTQFSNISFFLPISFFPVGGHMLWGLLADMYFRHNHKLLLIRICSLQYGCFGTGNDHHILLFTQSTQEINFLYIIFPKDKPWLDSFSISYWEIGLARHSHIGE